MGPFRFAIDCFFIAVCLHDSTALAADELLKHVRTIPLVRVEGRIDHMSITPDGRRLFVAALGNNSVELVDVQGEQAAQAIGPIKEPQGVFFIPDSEKLAVSSAGDGALRVYDRALERSATVKDLDDADNVRYDPKAKLLYVGYGSGALAVIDPENATRVADIRLDGHPESFQLESKGPRVFVNVPTARQVAVVDRNTRTVVAKWPLADAQANFPMALDEANGRLFVGCRKPSKLLILDTSSGKTVAALDCCGDVDDVFYDAATQRILLTGGEGCISVVKQTDADHYQLLGSVHTASGARTSLFVAQPRMLYVAVPHRGNQPAEIRVYQISKQ